MSALRRLFRRAWNGLRTLSGDDAYERYLEHHRRRHPGAVPLGRAEFQVAEFDRRWSQVSRCC